MNAAASWRRPSPRMRSRRRRATAILGVPLLVVLASFAWLLVGGLDSFGHTADGVTPTDIESRTTVVVPAGWQVALADAPRQDCLAYVEQNWTDMRPASLIRAMQDKTSQDKTLQEQQA